MAQQEFKQNSATGGISQASKIGLGKSVAYLRGADIRTDPSEIRALPGARYDSASITILGTTEDTFNPNAHEEVTTVDGPVSREVGSTSGLLLYDNFNDNSINTDKWGTSGTVAEEGGRLRVGKKDGSGGSGSASTNGKTTGNPAGDPIDSSVQWYQNWNAGGAEGPDVYCRIVSGSDWIEVRSQHAVNTTVITGNGIYSGVYGFSGKAATIKIYEDGTSLKVDVNGVTRLTMSNTSFASNTHFEAVSEGGSGTNFYIEVDNLYINGTVNASEAFSTLRGNAGTTSGDSDVSGKAVKLISGASANYDEMGRSAFLFDISNIPSGATINSLSLEPYVTNIIDEIGSQQITVVDSSPATDTELVQADFANVDTVAYSSATNISGLTAGQYNAIALNATAITAFDAALAGDGIYKVGLALEADRSNTDPSAGTSKETSVSVAFAESSTPPILRVNYTVTSPDEARTRDLVKWIKPGTPYDNNIYSYDRSGNMYKRTSDGVYSLIRTITNSAGQGLEIFDDYVYYTQNDQLGRYGPLSGAAVFDDDFLTGLEVTSDFAPMIQFLDYVAVCHGNEVKKVFGTETPTDDIGAADLSLPVGYNIRAVAQVGEFLAFGAWRGTDINAAETGKIFFWDGTAIRYNFIVNVPEGAVNAMASMGGTLLYMAGNKGSMMAWERGPLGRVWQVPKQKIGDYLEVWPGAMTVWQALLHIGIAANTNSISIKHGIYAYGTRDPRLFPPALSHDYWQSTGDIDGDANIKIGATLAKGQDLFFSWGDKDGKYGIDMVSIGNDPAPEGGTVEYLRHDDEDTSRSKMAGDFIVTHEKLSSANNDSITMKKDVNRTGTYKEKSTVNTEEDSEGTTFSLTGEYREIDLAFDFTGKPIITGMKFEFDDQRESLKP